jgi:DNA-binding transcriptional MerR regulator
MDITEVRKRTGLSAATLHHYEQVGLVTTIGRIGLHRQYRDDVVDLLAVIAVCQRSGFSLHEIRDLIERRAGAEWKTLARSKIDQIEERITHLEQARNGLVHALACTSPDIMRCQHFRATLNSVYPPPSTAPTK